MCETSVRVGFTSGFQSHSVTLWGEWGAALAVSATEGRLAGPAVGHDQIVMGLYLFCPWHKGQPP